MILFLCFAYLALMVYLVARVFGLSSGTLKEPEIFHDEDERSLTAWVTISKSDNSKRAPRPDAVFRYAKVAEKYPYVENWKFDSQMEFEHYNPHHVEYVFTGDIKDPHRYKLGK
jgi:hypothetical protein